MRTAHNANMIRNPADEYGSEKYNAHSPMMRVLLGLTTKAKLPAEGMAPRVIQGWTVYVAPIRPGGNARHSHRVRAICPDCRRDISAGRTHQHKCKTEAPCSTR